MLPQSDQPVIAEAKRIAAEFEYSSADVNRGVKKFLSEMEIGLTGEGSTLSQIPSYITCVPDGSEKGVYLAVDLGGTNIRVCSIHLNGDSTFDMTQEKAVIPRELMVSDSAAELFGFIAEQIECFLQKHHEERYASHTEKRRLGNIAFHDEDIFDLGFTFSFPVIQTAINKGNLYRWTKGFDIRRLWAKMFANCYKMLSIREIYLFDNPLEVLPNTRHDQELDGISVNPGVQMFEKRVSGMFLGEILRCTILHMNKNPALNLCGGSSAIPKDSILYQHWGIDTKFLSTVEGDSTDDLREVKEELRSDLGIENASTTDCKAIKVLTHAIGKRAARLSAVPLAAIIISSGRLGTEDVIDIGVDGSLIEFYPGYEKYIREAWREIPEIGEKGEKKIQIGIAKDGSGVGAALSALVARQAEKRKQG
ncbi:hexokinase [Coccidioides immitis RMSCC 3703]|uniref:Phosphotransferase n=1 Tax=Coccidioides immitis RMSCC 3703 TaxID=454286 RepID=A0A0J8RAH6_COCIT|nr:hexokinase [Coccidioides immitis RMSCC 3703]